MVAAGRASGIKSWSHCLSAHITPTLISLHWLHVPECTSLKLAVLTYRSIHSTLPSYLQSSFSRVTDMTSRRRLRSSASHRLVVPPVRLSTVGKRAFQVAGANMWNDVPFHITSAQSLAVFRQRLKSFLFSRSYPHMTHLSLWTIIIVFFSFFSGISRGPCNN